MKRLKILIVDDVMIMRKVLKEILAAHNKADPHIILEAVDGTDALFMYNQTKPDIVFLDIAMPDYDGKTIVKELLEIDSKVKIIMYTGSSDKMSVIECIRTGAKDYVVKPPNRQRVIKALEKVAGIAGAAGEDEPEHTDSEEME